MGNEIGSRIKLEGEREFRQAIKGINTEMRTLSSEMSLATSQFEKNEKSVESLTAINEVLYKQQQKQSEKVEVLRQALEKSRAELGDNNAQTQRWQQQLNNAQAELNRLNRQLSENEEALEDARNGMSSFENEVTEMERALNDTADEANIFGDVLKANIAGNLISSGAEKIIATVSGIGEQLITYSNDSQKALNSLSAQTGATGEELKNLEGVMKGIYRDNFGESLDEIAQSMAIVRQQTGQTGEELKETTKMAYLMQDTFDFDIRESMLAVNSLMKQFGLTSKQAYNLIAQGAQKGLNQNDDLLDVVNEYSNQFAQAGLSADNMFNMIANGAQDGTWSIDKMGDAFKEFSIRMNDGTADDYLKQLGLDAEEVVCQFQEGGNSAKEAMQTISNALKGCTDETLQYQAGVGLLGTMYEDMGLSACTALLDTQGEISSTVDALGAMNNVKYNDLNSSLQALGRQIVDEIATPLGDKLQPKVQEITEYVNAHGSEIAEQIGNVADTTADFIGWILNNSDKIMGVVSGIGAAMLTWNVATMVSSVVTKIKAFQTATEGATIAQAAFNAVMSSNPIGLVVTAVTGLATALISYNLLSKKSSEKTEELTNRYKELAEKADELNKKTNGYARERKELVDTTEEEAIQAQILANKLYELSSAEELTNGQKLQQQELVKQLNDMYPDLGLAIDSTTGSLNISKEAVENYINSAKDMAVIQELQERYSEIAKDEADALIQKQEAQDKLKDVTQELNAAMSERNQLEQDYTAGIVDGDTYNKACEKVGSLAKEQQSLQDAISSSDSAIKNCNNEYETIENTMESYSKSLTEATSKTDELEKAAGNAKGTATELSEEYAKTFDTMSKSIENAVKSFNAFNGGQEYTKAELIKNLNSQIDGIKEWKDNLISLASRCSGEFVQYLSELGTNGANVVKTLNSMTDSELNTYVDTWQRSYNSITDMTTEVFNDVYQTADTKQKEISNTSEKNGKEMGGNYAKGAENGIKSIDKAVTNTTKAAKDEFSNLSKETGEQGKHASDSYAQGLSDGKKTVSDTSNKLKDETCKPFNNIMSKGYSYGVYYTQGLVNGMNSKKASLAVAAKELSDTMLNTTQTALDIHSPSKKAKLLGSYYTDGLAEGIKSKKKYAEASAGEVAQAVLSKAEQHLANVKVYYNVTLKEEMDYWNKVRKECKKGTQARIDADAKYLEAKKEYTESIKEKEKEEAQAAKEKAESIKKVNTEWAAQQKEVLSQLKQDVAELWEEYDTQVASKTKNIASSAGGITDLFDYTANISKYETKDTLKEKMKSQVEGLKEWQSQLAELRKKGIEDGMLEELESMGAEEGLGYVKLINEMSASELQEYNSLWKQKQKIAKTEATAELEALKEETNTKIKELTKEANTQIKEYFAQYKEAIKEAGGQLNTTMVTFATKVSENGELAITKTTKKMKAAASSSSSKANIKSATTTLAKQVKSATSTFETAGKALAQATIKGMKNELSGKSLDISNLTAGVKTAASDKASGIDTSTISSTILSGLKKEMEKLTISIDGYAFGQVVNKTVKGALQ